MSATAEPAVLDRLLEPLGICLTPEVARRIVLLRADPVAQARVDELARTSAARLLSPEELDEHGI